MKRRTQPTATRIPVTFGLIETERELIIRFRDEKCEGGIQRINLSPWLQIRNIAVPACEYICNTYHSKERTTRLNVSKLIGYFIFFLVDENAKNQYRINNLDDITTDIVDEYEDSLNKKETASGERLTDLTKSIRYNQVRSAFSYLRADQKYASKLPLSLRFKRNPWPKSHRGSKPREPVPLLDIARIRRACINEITLTYERLEIGLDAACVPAEDLPEAGVRSLKPYRELKLRLAAIIHRYNAKIPSAECLAVSDTGLGRSLRAPYGSLRAAGEHLHFTARSLVPFIVLLAIDSAFNPEGLLSLSWSDIERHHPIFGSARWRVTTTKERAGRRPFRSFATAVTAIEAPINLLLALDRYTQFTRPHLPERHRDRVFVFRNTNNGLFQSFDADMGVSSDETWHSTLRSFVEDNSLGRFTLSQLRKSSGEIVDHISGGDIKSIQVALGHASTSTTDLHYRTAVIEQRGREAIATAMAWRKRFLATNGRSDTRTGLLVEGGMTAATPGFGCFEPLFSPLPGQRAGSPCNGYGLCPACPLAWVNVSKPKAYLHLKELSRQLTELRARVHPARWLKVWAPQGAALDEIWLPRFPKAVVAKADGITLPNLPPLE